MKAHLAKVSLALLSAVFLLGCQEQGSGPVGLEGLGPEFARKCDSPPCPKDDKDNNEGPNVDVTLTGGITSSIISDDGSVADGAQRATLSSDGGRVAVFNTGVGFRATLALTTPPDFKLCQHENQTANLHEYLNFTIGDREQDNQAGDIAIGFQFHVQRKKGSGQFLVIWRYPDDGGTDAGKGIRVRLSSDNVVVDDDDPDAPDVTTFTYHFPEDEGGTVEVRRSPSIDGGPGNDKLTCPYVGSGFVIELDRSPS